MNRSNDQPIYRLTAVGEDRLDGDVGYQADPVDVQQCS